jgi:hypothetical protein
MPSLISPPVPKDSDRFQDWLQRLWDLVGNVIGGSVIQITSKATGVTLNRKSGEITLQAAALGSGAKVTFTVTNNFVGVADVPVVCVKSGGTANAYRASVTAVAAGSFAITVENITGGSLSEAPKISFVIIKGATA